MTYLLKNFYLSNSNNQIARRENIGDTYNQLMLILLTFLIGHNNFTDVSSYAPKQKVF